MTSPEPASPFRELLGKVHLLRGETASPLPTSSASLTGHFAKDCFMQPGGTKYSLIPDEEEAEEEAESAELEKPDPTRNSSRKRKKVSAGLPLFYHIFLSFKTKRYSLQKF